MHWCDNCNEMKNPHLFYFGPCNMEVAGIYERHYYSQSPDGDHDALLPTHWEIPGASPSNLEVVRVNVFCKYLESKTGQYWLKIVMCNLVSDLMTWHKQTKQKPFYIIRESEVKSKIFWRVDFYFYMSAFVEEINQHFGCILVPYCFFHYVPMSTWILLRRLPKII